ncbi:hypothetical protein I7I50_02943 [Histoplasma capsulatum G186AR]|uniref:Uncharacterized protein n=1 Tax=Ajellomyces capsulatus TaxID=5037 RepID=A0A8H8D5K7_AJECA|nr:hypothetical protein I7I52_00391 [Histoplasma capsulatum]QSS71924.1 hypothetical protein I7I50_02943 [Histoplasma capsulatum G186AR]
MRAFRLITSVSCRRLRLQDTKNPLEVIDEGSRYYLRRKRYPSLYTYKAWRIVPKRSHKMGRHVNTNIPKEAPIE